MHNTRLIRFIVLTVGGIYPLLLQFYGVIQVHRIASCVLDQITDYRQSEREILLLSRSIEWDKGLKRHFQLCVTSLELF